MYEMWTKKNLNQENDGLIYLTVIRTLEKRRKKKHIYFCETF